MLLIEKNKIINRFFIVVIDGLNWIVFFFDVVGVVVY